MTIKCDVLVIGAGPAGSSAARAASQRGANTILIEKKAEIGVPVRSAEGIGKYLFSLLPFKIPKEQLIWELEGVALWKDDMTIEKTGGIWSSYAINRRDFDKFLVNKAIHAGAELLMKTELVDLKIGNDYQVKKAVIKTHNSEREIEPKIIIASDGVDSAVLRLMGFEIDKRKKCGEAYSFEMENLRLEKPRYEQIYIGDFAPKGYGYMFPKSKTRANVGVASLAPEKKLEQYYEEFLEIPVVKRQVRDGVNVEERGGWTPFYRLTDSWVYGNVLLAGDTAAQNMKPLMEGFLPAIICGDIAGKTAGDCLTKNVPLEAYEDRVKKRFVFLFKESDKYTRAIEDLHGLKDEQLHLLLLGLSSGALSIDDIEALKKEDHNLIKKRIEKWRNSRYRKLKTGLIERFAILYLKLLSR